MNQFIPIVPARHPLFCCFLLLLSVTIVSCDGKSEKKKGGKETKGDSVAAPPPGSTLGSYRLDERDPDGFDLPSQLREISGITFTDDGRLFAHGDERGVIFQIDTANGEIIKKFTLGEKAAKEDFEDIASVDQRFYMVTSGGKIYEFPEGDNESSVAFTIYTTPLGSANDVEGLCFDPATNSLLLACKAEAGPGYEGKKGIYSFSLATKQLDPKPRFLLAVADLVQGTTERAFNPSGIARNPESGTFFLMTSANKAIAEISADGRVLTSKTFGRGAHQQPEGIAFSPDMRLFISDEGGDDDGRISEYRR